LSKGKVHLPPDNRTNLNPILSFSSLLPPHEYRCVVRDVWLYLWPSVTDGSQPLRGE
jgi:hypothetical protein